MTRMECIYITAYNAEHVNFASRFRAVCSERSIRLGVIVLDRSLAALAASQALDVIGVDVTSAAGIPSSSLKQSTEFLAKRLTLDQCHAVEASLHRTLLDKRKLLENAFVMVWLPFSIFGKTVSDFCVKYSISKIFLEFSNFPGRMQADPRGINSMVVEGYKDYSSLYDERVEEVEHWCARSLAQKNQQRLPQASHLGFSWGSLLDKFRKLISAENALDKRMTIKVIWLMMRLFYRIKYDNTEQAEDFFFYPCQVTEDSQLLFNSAVDNLGAIEICHREAKACGKQLIIKLHPAEGNFYSVIKLLKLRKSLGFFISSEPAIDLISRSYIVYTVNSTVGQEAILMGADVRILGNAFYSGWTRKRLLSHLYFGLWRFDYWSKENVSPSEFDDLLGRLSL